MKSIYVLNIFKVIAFIYLNKLSSLPSPILWSAVVFLVFLQLLKDPSSGKERPWQKGRSVAFQNQIWIQIIYLFLFFW